ncbi:MAG: DUF3574 domain-containing protein [Acidobacteriaceae bacterium]
MLPMTTSQRLPLAALLLALSPLAAQTHTSATLHGDPSHPPHAIRWVDTKLYFGLGPASDPTRGATEAQWQDFLDHEVTPRFPAGLSVLDIYGQWQGATQSEPEHERTKLLIVDYPSTPENNAKVEAIRLAWKQRTHAQSVLKVTQPADVSF